MAAIAIRILILAGLAVPTAALAAHSDWVDADEARLRLLLTEPAEGRIAAGIEIELEPGWYTYWRNPGEAGVPPVFDFSGSENVGDVTVRYPAPTRHDDGASVSLVYTDTVVFPLSVEAARCRKACDAARRSEVRRLQRRLHTDPSQRRGGIVA